MSQLFFSCSIALLVAALTVACTQSVTTPTAVSAPASAAHAIAQLEGSWLLVSIQRAGEAKQNRPFDSTYTLTFNAGRLSTRADCNTCVGSYSVEGVVLTAGPGLACTRAACPTAAFENAYTSLLSGDSQIVVSDSMLTLTSARGTLQLVRSN